MNRKKKLKCVVILCVIFFAIIVGKTIVSEAAKKPALNCKKKILYVGDEFPLKIKNKKLIKDADISWGSSDGNVAWVKEQKIIAQNAGDTIISCKIKTDKTLYHLTVNVTVKKPNISEAIKKNNGQMAEEVKMCLTTQKAVAFTFRGLSNKECVENVLDTLDSLGAKGTFFVTISEIEQYPDLIKKIYKKGHEIGNGGLITDSRLRDLSLEEVCNQIYLCDRKLKNIGIEAKSYMPGNGFLNDTIKEAVSVMNQLEETNTYTLVMYSKAPIVSRYKEMTSEEIVSDYLKKDIYLSLRMGEIVYFQMNSALFKDNNVIPDVVNEIGVKYVKNGYGNSLNTKTNTYDYTLIPLNYNITTIQDLITNPDVYTLNPIDTTVDYNKNPDYCYESMIAGYIGNKYISGEDLYGFSSSEKSELDITEEINTNGKNVIFLTFDDYGNDPVVRQILDVLDKHKAKGSFFAIARNADLTNTEVTPNPNILREIGLRGHDIGSHTYSHKTLATEESILEQELVKSYQVLSTVVGDLNTLQPYFRPPELLITKNGLLSVFRSGYQYSISGNCSTHDYMARNSAELLEIMNEHLKQYQNKTGHVIVMHFNNQSIYTAEAIDKFITQHKGDYEFAKLSDYLTENNSNK